VVRGCGPEAVEAIVNENSREPVLESEDAYMTEEEFCCAFAAVLKREAPVFQALADHDAGVA
jgi:hypothetical protein